MKNRRIRARRESKRIPAPIYEALPYLYGCLGIGLFFWFDSVISFVMGFVLLVSAGLVVLMRNSARKRAFHQRQQRRQRDLWE